MGLVLVKSIPPWPILFIIISIHNIIVQIIHCKWLFHTFIDFNSRKTCQLETNFQDSKLIITSSSTLSLPLLSGFCNHYMIILHRVYISTHPFTLTKLHFLSLLFQHDFFHLFLFPKNSHSQILIFSLPIHSNTPLPP